MNKIIKYELTKEEIDLLNGCVNGVAQDCDRDCYGCPFYLLLEKRCVLDVLQDIADSYG